MPDVAKSSDIDAVDDAAKDFKAAKEIRITKYQTRKLIELLGDYFVGAYFLMLSMGGLHDQLAGRLPAVSYWTALLIILAVRQLIPAGVYSIGNISYMLEKSLGYKK